MASSTRLRDPARTSAWVATGLAFVGIGATMTFPHPWLSPEGTISIATAAFLSAVYCFVRAFRYGFSGVVSPGGVSYPQFMQTREQLRSMITSQSEELAVLRKEITEQSEQIKSIHAADVRIFNANLALDHTLRNRVLALVAELREIYSRVDMKWPYPGNSDASPDWRVNPGTRQRLHMAALNSYYAQRWEQYLKIYHGEFEPRIKAIVSELQMAGVASEELVAFPKEIHGDPLPIDEHIPLLVPNTLIPELLSAADALTRSRPLAKL